jgi:hypothetical protein
MDKGSVVVPDDFNDPLPPELLAQFLGVEVAELPQSPARKKRRRQKRK